MKVSKRIGFGFAIVVTLSTIAFIVRLILFPDISVSMQIFLFLLSIGVIGLYLSGFYLIDDLFNRKLPYSRNLLLRIILQVATGFMYVIVLRTLMFIFLGDYAPFSITTFFTATVYLLDFFISVAINIGFFANYFFKQWKESLVKAQQLEKEKIQVQYNSLKNQLNPHFLFNTLTSLNSLIFEDQELASQYLRHLSKLYRYLLENKEVVSLEKELLFLENYLFILKTRFGESLQVRIDIKEEDMNFLLVPVTLQNLIENAIKHNVINKDQPLTISLYSQNGFLYVQNKVQRKRIVETSNKQGLENMKMLYKYLSEKELQVEEKDDQFLVKIPLIP